MTLPRERAQAMHNMREFCLALSDPKQTPRVPRAVRQRALRALRHYPWKSDVARLAERSPDILLEESREQDSRADAGGLGESAGDIT